MNKKVLFLPIAILSLLTSCAGDPKVNEQELFDALNLKDVTYLQFDMYSNDDEYQRHDEFSPDAYHWFGEGPDVDYHEEYIFKRSSYRYELYYRDAKEGKFTYRDNEGGDKFRTIEDFRDYAFGPISARDYEDYTYNEETKEYEIAFSDSGIDYFTSIKFSNKKCVKYTTYFDDELNEMVDLTYNEKTLTPPSI